MILFVPGAALTIFDPTPLALAPSPPAGYMWMVWMARRWRLSDRLNRLAVRLFIAGKPGQRVVARAPAKRPNAETAAAIDELEAGGGHIQRGTSKQVIDAILHDC